MKHIKHTILPILIIVLIAGILGFPGGETMSSKEIATILSIIFFIIAYYFIFWRCCSNYRPHYFWHRHK